MNIDTLYKLYHKEKQLYAIEVGNDGDTTIYVSTDKLHLTMSAIWHTGSLHELQQELISYGNTESVVNTAITEMLKNGEAEL